MVLESMSSALQQSITFEDQDVPKLPTLEPKDITQSSDSESATLSTYETLRPLTHSVAIPSPILESPKRSALALHMSVNGTHLVAPPSPGRTRRYD